MILYQFYKFILCTQKKIKKSCIGIIQKILSVIPSVIVFMIELRLYARNVILTL